MHIRKRKLEESVKEKGKMEGNDKKVKLDPTLSHIHSYTPTTAASPLYVQPLSANTLTGPYNDKSFSSSLTTNLRPLVLSFIFSPKVEPMLQDMEKVARNMTIIKE